MNMMARGRHKASETIEAIVTAKTLEQSHSETSPSLTAALHVYRSA